VSRDRGMMLTGVDAVLSLTQKALDECEAEARANDGTIAALRKALAFEVSLHPYDGDVPDFVREALNSTAEAAKAEEQRIASAAVAPWREALSRVHPKVCGWSVKDDSGVTCDCGYLTLTGLSEAEAHRDLLASQEQPDAHTRS
jgi:hypothetical protein